MKVVLSFITIGESKKMLGIQEIVGIEEYNATHKPFCDKCE